MNISRELYALGANRSHSFVIRFLDEFLPDRVSLLDDYPIPESIDEVRVFLRTEVEILTYLEENVYEPYGLYWVSASLNDFSQAMVFLH